MSTVLSSIYNNDPIKTLKRTIEKWTADGFGAELMGFGGSVTGSKKKEDSFTWIEKTDLLEDIINHNIDNSYYYIVFDELDEDYRDFKTGEEQTFYINLLTSLFKAVQDVKACFKDDKINILPIVFLRSDIYGLLNDSDKNKWSDFKLDLSWSSSELKTMISHRISKTLNTPNEKPYTWNSIFSNEQVKMGHRDRKSMDVFSYITRSTHMRPRDYIHYVRECAKLSLQKKENVISAETVKEVDRNFSEYLKNEIIDEIHGILPTINEVFSLLSRIRKQTFPTNVFITLYTDYYKGSDREIPNAENVLRILFEHGVIGNQPSMKGQQIFIYQYPNALFNFKENVIIHRGLYKALQIF